MIALALVPVLVGVVAAITASRLGTVIAPAIATVLLTALALTVSLATGLVLCLAAYVGASEVLPLPKFRALSVDVLRDDLPLPPAAGLAAGAVAVVLLGCAVVHLARVVSNSRRASAAVTALPSIGELAIVEDDAAYAYAVPGRQARIVVSTGLLRSLSGPQRRALLAHEEAHLRRHHYVYVQLARLAAAANPLMRPVSRAVDGCVERWADAAAVRAVGDRTTVARALAIAALAPTAMPLGALAVAHSDVVDRVRDLLDPPARRPHVGAALFAATVLCWASAAVVVLHVHGVMEIAETAGH